MAVEHFREEDVLNVMLCPTSAGGCLRGTYGRTGLQVSIKLLSSRTLAQSEWSEWMRNVAVVRQVSSQRVLVPLGVYKAWCLTGLLYDWMPQGSLHSLLYQTQMYPSLPMRLRLGILSDVAEGLCHLHSIPLAHQALKPTNVLLDQQYRAKLCDWGLPGKRRGGPHFKDLVYLSPEGLAETALSVEADIYSFGVLLWETLNRRKPDGDLLQLLSGDDAVGSGQEGELLPRCVPRCHTLSQLMTGCWSADPHRRPPAEYCALELRSAIATFGPDEMTRATLSVRENKERALDDSKIHPAKDIPLEINNLQPLSGSKDSKSVGKKSMALLQKSSLNKTLLSPATVLYTEGNPLKRQELKDCVSGSVTSCSSPRCHHGGLGSEHYTGTGQRPSPLPTPFSSPPKALNQDPPNQPRAISSVFF
ncbi:receptor-interacting serine/threonine-protein kinase 2 isoform X2 [Esox lucius]|uniref:receptor-interacting serine/threonine-protein kinase 2 isoform X2 n=1 Tax=Esox lucius TaxID=8010 RepID=UPI00147707B6|nr:receptor-interacting serine/threonine-protein kinase 2 isoform X2 [Esox lucius]